MLVRRSPPPLSVTPSWRDIYRSSSFGQRELISGGPIARQAGDRSIRLGIGWKPFEEFDHAGALKPIAFASGGYRTGVRLPSADDSELVFRDEADYEPWEETYAWEADGLPEITALYSPWQGLYLDEVAEGGGTSVPLGVLVLEGEDRERALASVTGWYRSAQQAWRVLDDDWRPIVKLLVILQNRYWPQVSGRVALLPDLDGDDDWIEAGRGDDMPTATALLTFLGCDADEVVASYHYLVDRGMDREPNDGLMTLRRARHRAFHIRWRGLVRRAQDNFDAAEMLRLFLADLVGESPPPPDSELMDGRQEERRWLYEHGPAAPIDDDKLKQVLIETQLYPHGVEVIGEGPSEERLVDTLVAELLHPLTLDRVSHFNLEGVGAAKHLPPLARGIGRYAERTVVVVDNEGEMGEYARALVANGELDNADLCLSRASLEEDNATPGEMLELAAELARNPMDERIDAVELVLSESELMKLHHSAADKAHRGSAPGLADSVIALVRRHDPPVRIDKPDLAELLARRMANEYVAVARDQVALSQLYERRPVLRFFVDRVVPVLNKPRPIS